MANETDSSSSSSLEQKRNIKKFNKKLKKKSKKKEKRSHQERKRSQKEIRKTIVEEDNWQIKKCIPSQPKYEDNSSTHENATAFGPALPPHLLNKNEKVEKPNQSVIGPIIPAELVENLNNSGSQNVPVKELGNFRKAEDEDDNLQGCYGPLPVTNDHEMTPVQLELEQRALELKMAAIDGVNVSSNQNVREEWMLELPDVGLKGGLAALHNLKRTFHQGKEKPDFTDRSSWTKTSNSRQNQHSAGSSKDELKLQAHALQEKQRDAEQEAIAKEHHRKNKHKKSLVEIHQKKLRKEEKRKLKEFKKNGTKPERRPFTRDVDLKLNKIDRNQTKQIVDKAKILNTKFSSGQSKYL